MGDSPQSSSNTTVITLTVCLLVLIVLLFFLYKKLNWETDGEYTIRHMVYKQGGVRDQVRDAVSALETRLGVQLWPHSDTDEDGEEMQEVRYEEERVDEGGSQGSDGEGDDQDEEEEEEEDEDEEGAQLCGNTKGKGDDISGERSSLEDSEAGEQTVLRDQSEAKEETEKKKDEKEEKAEEGEGKGEASGGAGLLIDLKQFTGSAIWSGEGGGSMDRDVTAL